MLIHIINGTYGHRPKLPNGETSNYIVPTTRNDLPIDVEEAEAARLVRNGIAEYVNAPAVGTPRVTSEHKGGSGNMSGDKNEGEGTGAAGIDPVSIEGQEYSLDMRADELRAAMRQRGLPVKIGMTKADMVKALNEAEDLPELTVQDVVDE